MVNRFIFRQQQHFILSQYQNLMPHHHASLNGASGFSIHLWRKQFDMAREAR